MLKRNYLTKKDLRTEENSEERVRALQKGSKKSNWVSRYTQEIFKSGREREISKGF
jgi:hypothetical protein